ncbi:MAG: hypothetical protein NZ455_11680 [Bacteroidia bacterium]|nr:hypothetical protein [Bacteroidia bacterium]MDW8347589.1 hypothetical protein [Bacteroidia bacterium]
MLWNTFVCFHVVLYCKIPTESFYIESKNNFTFGRVPRCARVGLLRTTLSLRCYATASHCLRACSVSLTQSFILMFYAIGTHIFALPFLRLIIKQLQD